MDRAAKIINAAHSRRKFLAAGIGAPLLLGMTRKSMATIGLFGKGGGYRGLSPDQEWANFLAAPGTLRGAQLNTADSSSQYYMSSQSGNGDCHVIDTAFSWLSGGSLRMDIAAGNTGQDIAGQWYPYYASTGPGGQPGDTWAFGYNYFGQNSTFYYTFCWAANQAFLDGLNAIDNGTGENILPSGAYDSTTGAPVGSKVIKEQWVGGRTYQTFGTVTGSIDSSNVLTLQTAVSGGPGFVFDSPQTYPLFITSGPYANVQITALTSGTMGAAGSTYSLGGCHLKYRTPPMASQSFTVGKITQLGGTGWKRAICFAGKEQPSFQHIEITLTQNVNGPIGYTQEAQLSMQTMQSGTYAPYWTNTTPFYVQESWDLASGPNWAQEDTSPPGNQVPLVSYPNFSSQYQFQADTWYQFMVKVHIGTLSDPTLPYGTPTSGVPYDSTVEVYVAPRGQKFFQKLASMYYPQRYESGTSDSYASVQLTPYMTGLTSSLTSLAQVWYTKWGVSTNPIPCWQT